MNSTARKFVPRAPRYTLRPTDNRFLRFAHQGENGKSYTTRFLDISMTGLAFIIDREHAPQISETIKVEVPLAGADSVAWWARVVRMEEYEPYKWYLRKADFDSHDQVLVAVHFQDMPSGHRLTIKKTLDQKFAEEAKANKFQKLLRSLHFLASQFWQLFIYGLCVAASIWFLWYFSRPSSNYDEKIGAPWGQRYPQFNIFTPEEK